MIFPEQQHNELVALGNQARRARQKGLEKQYQEALVLIDRKQQELLRKFPHFFQLQGAQQWPQAA